MNAFWTDLLYDLENNSDTERVIGIANTQVINEFKTVLYFLHSHDTKKAITYLNLLIQVWEKDQ